MLVFDQFYRIKKNKGELNFFETQIPVFAFKAFAGAFIHFSYRFWRWDNYFVTRLPVGWRGNFEFISSLEGFDQPDDLRYKPPVLEGVIDHSPHNSLVIDEKDTPDCGSRALPLVDHPVFLRHFHGEISDNRERDRYSHLLLYRMNPRQVSRDTVNREANELDIKGPEFVVDTGERHELGSTYRCKVGRMGEHHNPSAL